MARTTQDPNALVEVVWADTGDRVSIPWRLLNTGNKGAQMRHLVATGQLPDPEAPPLPVMDTPAEVQQAVIDAAALQQVEARLSRLERQPAPILPSEESLAQWAMAAQRVGLSHAELASLQEQTTRAIEATAQAAGERLGELDAKQAALVSTVSDAVSEGQEAVAAAVLSMEQQGAATLVGIEEQALATAAEIARQQVGPQGLAGAGTVIALEDPTTTDPTSWAKRWMGRDSLVPGDGALVVSENDIKVYRYASNKWLPGPVITPKQELINATVSAVDTGNKIYGPGGGGGAGGGSSTGSDPLTVRTAAGTAGSSTQIADSSRWSVPLKARGLPSPTSARVAIQLTAADGAQAGKSLFILCGLLYEPGGTASVRSRYTEFSLLGDLKDNVDVDLTMQIQAAAAPGGLSVSVPAGVNATAIYLSITKNTVGTTRFILAGSTEWLLSQDSIPDAAHPSLLPAWQV